MDISDKVNAGLVFADEQEYMVSVTNFLTVLVEEGYLKKATSTRVKDAIMQRRLDWYNQEK